MDNIENIGKGGSVEKKLVSKEALTFVKKLAKSDYSSVYTEECCARADAIFGYTRGTIQTHLEEIKNKADDEYVPAEYSVPQSRPPQKPISGGYLLDWERDH